MQTSQAIRTPHFQLQDTLPKSPRVNIPMLEEAQKQTEGSVGQQIEQAIEQNTENYQ